MKIWTDLLVDGLRLSEDGCLVVLPLLGFVVSRVLSLPAAERNGAEHCPHHWWCVTV